MKTVEIKRNPSCGDILDSMKVGDVLAVKASGTTYNAIHNARNRRRKSGLDWDFTYDKLSGEITITRTA